MFALAVAGAAGTVSRYAVSGWSYRVLGDKLPYGTLVVNVVGCLLLAFVMQIALSADVIPRAWRMPITVGFFGAFTTFSTFGYETLRLMEDAAWTPALINVGANVILCLAAAWAGLALGRLALGGV